MTEGSVVAVVDAIARLLSCSGYDERASWLRQTAATLEQAGSDEEVAAAKAELHGIVLGMNGLLDMWLTPAERSGVSRVEATKELHRLAEQLYELTR